MLKKLVPETWTEQNTALFGASFGYQKFSNTADQSDRIILVMCIGSSFWYKLLEHVSPIQGWKKT